MLTMVRCRLRPYLAGAMVVPLVVVSFSLLLWPGMTGKVSYAAASGRWVLAQSPTTHGLNDVAMVSATEGWAVGRNGTILHYQNGEWNIPVPRQRNCSALTCFPPTWAGSRAAMQQSCSMTALSGRSSQFQRGKTFMLWKPSRPRMCGLGATPAWFTSRPRGGRRSRANGPYTESTCCLLRKDGRLAAGDASSTTVRDSGSVQVARPTGT